MDYNISLLPNPKIEQRLIDLSSTISRLIGSQLLLNKENSMPHVTLYLAGFPEGCDHVLNAKLENICSKYKPIGVQVTGWALSIRGLIMLNCCLSDELISLHEEIVTNINPLRGDKIANTWVRNISKLNERQACFLHSVGFPYAFDLWSPHFTISRIDPSCIGKVSSILDQFNDEFIGQTVGLGYSNDSGVFTRLISTHLLGSH